MQKLTAAQAVARGWVAPGRQLLTKTAQSFLFKAIQFWQSLFLGKPVDWGHAMRAAFGGMVISQDLRVRELPLAKWKGCVVRVWYDPARTPEQDTELVNNSRLDLGRLYDFLGIFGQALRPLLGKFGAEKIEAPWATICSEKVCLRDQEIDPAYMDGEPCQKSPAELDAWNRAHGWKCYTFELIG